MLHYITKEADELASHYDEEYWDYYDDEQGYEYNMDIYHLKEKSIRILKQNTKQKKFRTKQDAQSWVMFHKLSNSKSCLYHLYERTGITLEEWGDSMDEWKKINI